jgi:hypothetical protein
MRRLIGICIAIAALGSVAPAQAALPPVRHVWEIVLENTNYDAAFGPSSQAPYLAKTLTAKGQLLTQYYATGHLSLDNYISMVSGQAPNIQTQADCMVFTDMLPGVIGPNGQAIGQGCVYPAAVKTLADQLTAKGLTWRGYMQDMGTPCKHPAINERDGTQSATAQSQYAARHNPFVYFHSIIDSPDCAKYDVDLSRLPVDLASPTSSPNYAMIVPDLCADAHDAVCADGGLGELPAADAFLKEWVPKILASPAYADGGLIMITFDEAETGDASACCGESAGFNTPNPGALTWGPGGGRIGAVLISPFITPGTVNATPYNHYSRLRSYEDLFGLDHLGFAGQDGLKAFGDDVFTG